MSAGEERSAQGGKVIGASVAANASPAEATVGKKTVEDRGVGTLQKVPKDLPPFHVREHVHYRLTYSEDGRETQRRMLHEYEVCLGTPPPDFHRFQGIGSLLANLPGGQTHREDYRFNIVGAKTLAQAWEAFDDFAARGAKIAEDNFRRKYAKWEEQQRRRVLAAQGGAAGAAALLDAQGRPLGQ